ncbi:MAG: Uma2 family endonuclease [Polyangiaceae bacterium]
MVTSPLPAVYRLTYADWLRYPDDGRLYEILEGELYVTPSPSIEHQRISRDLEFLLLTFLRKAGCGEVLDAPVGVRLSDEDVLEPDLLVVLREHADRIGEQVIDGAPDLVVEILSPGTVRRDLGPKRAKYEEAGVPEYWVVDPATATIEVQVLHEGKYARHSLVRRGETLRSPLLPGLEIATDQVFVNA